MRDRRFVAVHRGGPLDRESHFLLARWAADCAERVLHFFEAVSSDARPRRAIEFARAWANGEVRAGVAMKASVQAHAAARAVDGETAIAAARAAGQAVATAHCADHCMGALLYALKALKLSGSPFEGELERQLKKLPPHLLAPVADGVHARSHIHENVLPPRSMHPGQHLLPKMAAKSMQKPGILSGAAGHSSSRPRPRVS